MAKGEKAGVERLDATATLDEARPLLLRALVKCGHIHSQPPPAPGASRADSILAMLKEPSEPSYKYFRELARDERATWGELRQKIDVVAGKLSVLAKRHSIDPSVAMRAAFLMRIGVDHPLGPLDVSAVVDLAALVKLLGEIESEQQPKNADVEELGRDAAMFTSTPRILTPLSKPLWWALREFGDRGARQGDVTVPGLSRVRSTRLREFKVLEAGDHARLEGRRWIAIGKGP